MTSPATLTEVWRGPFLECIHTGHAVICDANGHIIDAWGDPDQVILPRSSAKMIQALPLLESGAAKAFGLTEDLLALACASHQAAEIHTSRVEAWLGHLGFGDSDLRCGPQIPGDLDVRHAMIRDGGSPCQIHNNCSGKHSGFLTFTKHIGGGPEYVDIDHPLQKAIKDVFEDVTGENSPGFGIDGCSAPNFACTLHGMARAMAYFSAARPDASSRRERSAHALVRAMITYPELVAGETRACTELMRACNGRAALKTGADGVFIAILPEKKIGVALKIMDGSARGSECAIAALLVRLGVLNPEHPATLRRMNAIVTNRRGMETGIVRPAAGLI